MSFAVILHLDPAADAAVREIWSALAAAGIDSSMLDGSVRPHVTLTGSDHIERRALEAATAAFAGSLQPLRLTLSSIGAFNTAEGVAFLGVTVTHALLDAHAEYGRIFAHHARQLNAYFRAGAWVPHCTLATALRPAQLGEALAVIQRTPLPIFATAHELSLVHVTAGPVETLSVFQIGKPA